MNRTVFTSNDVPAAPARPPGSPPLAPATRADVGAPVIYSTGAAAKMCGISQQTIIRCFDNGTLKGFRVPGSKFRRIPRAALLAFMIQNDLPIDALGELSKEEAEAVAAKRGAPQVEQVTLRLTTADRLGTAAG